MSDDVGWAELGVWRAVLTWKYVKVAPPLPAAQLAPTEETA